MKQTFAERPATMAYDVAKLGYKTELWTNHALVKLPHEPIKLFEYNIDVYVNKKKLEKREEAGPAFRDVIRFKRGAFLEHHDFIYNDVNLLWSIKRLPMADGKLHGKPGSYIEVKFTNQIELGEKLSNPLQSYQMLATLVDAIATARVRFPKAHGNKFSVFKRCTFLLQDKLDDGAFDDAPIFVKLRNGVDARIGVSMGIKLNLRAGITACYDLTHTLFTRPGYPLVRLFWELVYGDALTDEELAESKCDEELQKATPSNENRELMTSVLKKSTLIFSNEPAVELDKDGEIVGGDLNVLKKKGRQFKFFKVSEYTANSYRFTDEHDNYVSVAEYFLKTHNIRLRYPNLPCIQKKTKADRTVLFPMELVSLLVDPVRFGGVMSEKLKSSFIQYTAFTANQRRLVLQHIIAQRGIGDCEPIVDNTDRYMRNHEISISKEMLTVKATVLPPPKVLYGNSDFHDTDHLGEWTAVTHDPIRTVLPDAVYVRSRQRDAPRLKKRLLGSIVKVGSPMNKTSNFEIIDTCYHNLMAAIEETGQPVCWERPGQAAIQGTAEYLQTRDRPGVIFDFIGNLKNNIDDKYKQAEDEVIVPFIIFIYHVRFTTLINVQNVNNDYNLFKWMCDNELGVFSQGMLSKTFNAIGSTPATCKFTRLLVEKVLGKIGTTHRMLERNEKVHKPWHTLVNPDEPTLVLGIDVCHPSSKDLKSEDPLKQHSVATLVGNIDIDCTEFRATSKIQDKGEERIVKFDDAIVERISEFVQHTNKYPSHIIVYRDGLSEGDFQRTLYEEKTSFESAFMKIDPKFKPTLTYIVVTKRHHTKFFLKDQSEGIEEQGFNVRPGTLVEDSVTTNNYYDFFLTTQVGQMGLAKPTHYYILWNTWNQKPSFWPTITHAFTYLFCRSTCTVALPSPVLYAHLAAKRAKETMDGAVFANRLEGRYFQMDSAADFHQLNNCLARNKDLDGMTFV